jgi:hypothetical protein
MESLADQIETKAKEIKTDGYPMSIGEVLSLYRDGDIEIHPEFQRIFRWTIDQKSRLIESLLLGIPIPPIFVSQRPDGIWDVIDGVQRLSTVLEFVGIYRNEEGATLAPSVLTKTEYLPALDGYTWEVGEDPAKVFSEALRRDIKRAKLEFRIVEKESDSNAKYDLFQRLNSGSQLSMQEARNCLLVMINKDLFRILTDLSQQHSFVACTPLTERQEDQAYRQELALRYFVQDSYSGADSELPEEYGEYVTSWMKSAAEQSVDAPAPFNVEKFGHTFDLLNETLGEDVFRRWDAQADRHLGPFSIACFEFVTSGVAYNFQRWSGRQVDLRERIRGVWNAPEFRSNSGTGVSPRRRVPKLINRAREYFASE